jgi:glycopeptide antibiotics resistance protein
MWGFIARFITTNWLLFGIFSVGWEILELYLPYEFAIESNLNKVSDLIVNTIGFWIGIRLRYSNENF